MTVIATMKRRRRQMKNGFRHLAKLGRPSFNKKAPADNRKPKGK